MQPMVTRFGLLLFAIMSLIGLSLTSVPAVAETSSMLTRYPYLTDSIQSSITINWATDRTGGTAGSVTWGPAGDCNANKTAATRTSITVVSKLEYQWKATIPVDPDTRYCYRVWLADVDLLGTDSSPSFTSQVAAGSTAPFSFAVFGDWGRAYANGLNPDQTNVLNQMASSGTRFAVMTGDTAYPNGGQGAYGDLQQAAVDTSTVFGPTFWAVPGRSLPVFNVTGNVGFASSTQIVNWPEHNAAATSGGKYLMESYPSINGSTAKSYPSMWYAFDAGEARFYMLTASWDQANIGTGSAYQNDHAAHWTTSSAQYQWLKADLEAHPNALKFAFWHYPLYADSSSAGSDPYLQGGAGTLQGLLDANNVAMAFNGHAHLYQRNKPDAAGLVSYVFGNGGAELGRLSGCSSTNLYALGINGSHCGAAPAGLTNDQVYGFAKVTVDDRTVTVTPTDEMGRTYDVQTYTFPSSEPDNTNPTAPTVTATVNSTAKITLNWSGATDNERVTGYRVFRDGVQLAEVSDTSFVDNAVSPGTDYDYTVVALDAAGNASPPSAAVHVSTSGAPDGTPPSQPTALTASAASSSQVNLSWNASTDNVAVTGYRVYRNGTLLPGATQPSPNPPTTYTDEEASPGTTYSYQVSAVDAAGNESSKASVSVTTPGITRTFSPAADARVAEASATSNYGNATTLVADGGADPDVESNLKFDVSGVSGSVTNVKLRLHTTSAASSASGDGPAVYGTGTGWTETGITWSDRPARTTAKLADKGAIPANTWLEYDVTGAGITGDGTYGFVVATSSTDGTELDSREATSFQPELIVTTGSG